MPSKLNKWPIPIKGNAEQLLLLACMNMFAAIERRTRSECIKDGLRSSQLRRNAKH